MGAIRKFMSISTAGLVDFRSEREKTSAYTRGTKRQAKKQTKILKQMAKRSR